MKKIVISEFMDEAAVDMLRQSFSVEYHPQLVDSTDSFYQALADADALIVRNRTIVDGSLLDRAPKVRAVGRLGVGLDNISLDECKMRSVKVIPATGCNDRSVAEYVIGCSMILIRQAYTSSARTVAGEWPRAEMIGQELSGKTFGFVGFGAIARETARIAKVFDCPIIGYDPFVSDDVFVEQNCTRKTLPELFIDADVISVHVPLNDSTRSMINCDTLGKMKKTAILINSARGGVVDEPALCQALKDGTIAGCALDVFASEPIEGDKALPFSGVPNLLLTPHIAGVTKESNVRVSAYIAQEIAKALA